MKLLYPSVAEKHIMSNRQWIQNNPLDAKNAWKKASVKYYESHKKQVNTNTSKYSKDHREWRNAYSRLWQKTPKGKVVAARNKNKRNRCLGHEMLNEWFDGCAQHHINNKQIVCIPLEIHKKYRHNHMKPETMVEINRLAMSFIFNFNNATFS